MLNPFAFQRLVDQPPTIAAWGAHGALNERGESVADMLTDAGIALHCLGTNGDGSPKHPLFVHGDTPLVPYRAGVTCHA